MYSMYIFYDARRLESVSVGVFHHRSLMMSFTGQSNRDVYLNNLLSVVQIRFLNWLWVLSGNLGTLVN